MRLESRLLVAVLLIPFGVASESVGCPVLPDEELRVSASFDAVGDLEVRLGWYADGEGFCWAGLAVDESRLNSLRFVPRPLDVLQAVRSAIERWHPASCSSTVIVMDDGTEPVWDRVMCTHGEFRMEDWGWSPIDPDSPC